MNVGKMKRRIEGRIKKRRAVRMQRERKYGLRETNWGNGKRVKRGELAGEIKRGRKKGVIEG